MTQSVQLAPSVPTTHRSMPIFGLGQPQRSPFLSTSDRLNCVVETTDNGRQIAALLGLPGLTSYATFGTMPARGLFVKEGTLTFIVAAGNQIILIAPTQPLTTLATLTTDSGPVWMDDNGTQLFINDGITPLIYTWATGVMTPVTAAGFQIGARGGVFLQGRFWVFTPSTATNPGRVYASAQYDGTSWNALDFFIPAARPTGIIAVWRWFNDLIIVGQRCVEWWSGTPTAVAGALGFQPSANANTEIGGKGELGMASVNQRLFMVGGGEGTVGIYEISGYSTEKISPPALDVLLSALPTTSTSVCCSYMASGHPIFQVTIPGQTAGAALTWIYDGLTGFWNKRSSYNLPYYRGLLSVHTLSTAYLTDAFTGTLYKMDETNYTEAGDPLEFEVTSTHLLKEGDRLALNAVQVDMETGLGNAAPPGNNPQGILQISKDGGHTWGQERFVPLGAVGQYTLRAQIRRLGAARDFAIKFRITEPIPRRVTGAYLLMEPGNA